MKTFDIANLRLYNQHLSTADFKNPWDVVSYFGAIQAQDYTLAKWSLGLRMQSATDEIIEYAFNEGNILRTHIMRPTWHFIVPEDIRYMLELTSTRVKKLMSHYNRKLELNQEEFKKCNTIIEKELRINSYLTRDEIAKSLEKNNIKARGQRLGHIVMNAELDALICSGPRRGKQFTYALLENWVPETKKLNHNQGLAKLALKYFTSHGPAQLKDFSWWSGLNLKESLIGLDFVKSKLTQETIDGKTYWFIPNSKIIKQPLKSYLLSIYDEYSIAYKDRAALGGERYIEKFLAMGNALTAVIILDGKIIGTWRKKFTGNKINIKLNLLRKISSLEKDSLSDSVKQFSVFIGKPVFLTT